MMERPFGDADSPVTHPATARIDTLVIGGGVAGFRAAMAAAAFGSVLVVTKDTVGESNTGYAQGGVAAVLGANDSVAAHRDDTLQVGQGLCNVLAVETVVGEGPDCIRELVEWGGHFDREGEALHLTREGGHSHHRVVHAHGDATGKEVVSTLVRRLRSIPNIMLWEFCFAVDVVVEDGRCVGAVVLRDRRHVEFVAARNTILCTGGGGKIYRETTNPEVATGDGLAMAWRAGLELGDLEFVQFHPTSLYVAGAARHLITEAVRGEGGHLVDARGDRFVFRYHADGELAPRDIVSHAIVQHLAQSGESCVYLDLSHLGDSIRERFPGLNRTCALYNLDITKDRIPVHPSAHYMIGGCITDLDGRTSLPGLFAAGEVALSGLHGANRLASNSLLEGLVFGRRAGERAGSEGGPLVDVLRAPGRERSLPSTVLHVPDMRNSIQSLMWRNVGIVRRGDRLREAARLMETWNAYVGEVQFDHVSGYELLNLLTLSLLVAKGALWREESRGTHYRTDFPERKDDQFQVHCVQIRGQEIQGRVLD